jgi:transcriptional regulator with XRE-family HTH domain
METNVRAETSVVNSVVTKAPATSVPARDYTRVVDDIARRLDEAREALGWSARQFSRNAGLSEGQFQKIRDRGGAGAETETIEALASAAGLSLRWVLKGEGPRERETEQRDPPTAEEPPQSSPDVPLTDEPFAQYQQIPGYFSMEREARDIDKKAEEWAWQELRVSNPLRDSRVPVTPMLLADLVRVVMRHGRPPAGVASKKKG